MEIEDLIGDANDELTVLQAVIRAIIIFISAWVCIRISGMRAFGKNSPFDVVVSIITGSVLARAIGGHVPFLPSIIAAFALSLIHRLLAMAALRSDKLSNILKGKEYLLVKEGKTIPGNMRHCNITEGDLLEGIRLNSKVSRIEDVKEAYFERSGQISAIPSESKAG